jgi:hypothetical protein
MFTQPIIYLDASTQESPTFEEMTNKGFHPKHRRSQPWTPEEVKQLKEAIIELVSSPQPPKQKDYSYVISHYTFHGTKSPAQVQYMINKHIRRINAKREQKAQQQQ